MDANDRMLTSSSRLPLYFRIDAGIKFDGGRYDSNRIRAASGISRRWFCFGADSTRVMTGYAATSGPHAVLWIAREAGLFEKNGIKAEVAYIRSGSTMAQTLVSGEIQMSQMGGPAMLAAGVAGMDVTFVAVALNTTPIVIMGTVSKMEESKRQSHRRDALRFEHRYFGAFRDP